MKGNSAWRPATAGVSASFGVRPYARADRETVRRICCDTAFLGRPIDPIFRDRDLFADLMTAPYLDYEPEWAWVAEADGQIVGYLLGSVDAHVERRQITVGTATVLRMLGRLAAGRYAGHPRSRQYLRWLILRGGLERPRRPKGSAHLHFNLLDGFRGRLGHQMWFAFDRRLRQAGIEKVYGEFPSWQHRRPEVAYSRYGFSEFDRRETTVFRPEVSETVHLVCAIRTQATNPARGKERRCC